ncbi:PREDICTED: probable 28S rRNA (cytosine-C(5))-methyltransferase [Diuraphis noxia]|uniref:probable 28S rRNA (cytosine-C(5))-methyltransferase n=1 Tax=Diuraphis noxia TaxID=143948 RepID=UPI0007637C33|nr:PREDICTED: probable 28S rRNA (cytosine-C(5))-methyltransferase [Diuraphis noxia]
MVTEKPNMFKNQDKTTGLYKIAAKILKKVKTGSSYKTQLYQAQYPNKLSLNAVLMNVYKWEKVIDVLIEKSNILEKENNMDRDLVYVLITEMMWSKFGLKGTAKNILAIKKYKAEFSKLMKENDLEKLCTSTYTKGLKPRFFRVNTLLTTLEEILEKLSKLKFIKLKSPKSYVEFLELIKSDKFKGKNVFVQDIHIKELLVFNSKVKFYEIEEYKNGSLIVQDKASCLAAYLLNPEPNSTVLDMCAAPGMKTSHLAAIMQNTGKLYAVDRCKDRFNIMQKMLEKYGVQNAETFNMDALTFPYYDDVKYILLDPSCSGSGIVDRVRNDSSGQNQNFESRLKKLANVHAQLLNHALKSYPNLERLVYSTCSANHEENEAVVDEALSVNGKFKLLNCTKIVEGWTNKGAPGYDCSEMCLNAVPSVDCTNGFFIAVFIRRDLEYNEVAVKEENIEDEEVVEEEENIKDIEDVIKEKVVEDIEIVKEEKVENNEIIDKKVKRVKKSNIHNTENNLESKCQNIKNKNIESTSLVKSKNAKRRERRLKLEKANKSSGLQTTKKKQKKVKSEET